MATQGKKTSTIIIPEIVQNAGRVDVEKKIKNFLEKNGWGHQNLRNLQPHKSYKELAERWLGLKLGEARDNSDKRLKVRRILGRDFETKATVLGEVSGG